MYDNDQTHSSETSRLELEAHLTVQRMLKGGALEMLMAHAVLGPDRALTSYQIMTGHR
jgi:hypothetical protein